MEASANLVSDIPAESSTPAKEAQKPEETPKMFSKMFKKKTGLFSPESETNVVTAGVVIVSTVKTDSEKSVSTSSDKCSTLHFCSSKFSHCCLFSKNAHLFYTLMCLFYLS